MKDNIHDIARQMGYKNNVEKSHKILFLSPVPDKSDTRYKNLAHMRMIQGMKNESLDRGFVLETDAVELKEFRSEIRKLNESDYDGIILLGYFLSSEYTDCLKLSHKPLIMLDPHVHLNGFDTILMDNRNAILELVDLLAEYGHRRIGMVSASDETNTNFVQRRNAFMEGMKNNQLHFRKQYDWRIGYPQNFEDELRSYINETRLKNAPLPTAVFCVNDHIANVLLKVCNEIGISISIAGYDHSKKAAENSLTTIDPGFESIGRTAAEALISRIHDTLKAPLEIKATARVIIRDSLVKIQHVF